MTEKRAGRPPKYTEVQVLEGIGIVERNGGIPTGDTVKKAMCMQLDVAGGINAQSLDKEVQRLLEERERQRREHLIGALPADARDAVKEIGALVEAAVLNHLGVQYSALTSLSGKKVAELKVDLANQREQIRELLTRIDGKDVEIADLEGRNHDLMQRLDTRSTEVAALKARLSELERDEDFRARMIEIMKETLGHHASSDGNLPPVRA